MNESQWDEATRCAREVELVCPTCTAANAPGIQNIDLGRDGLAICRVCSKEWAPPVTPTKPGDR
jgi:hypothetical protein